MGVHPLTEAIWEAGLGEVDPYVLMSQNMEAQYIITRTILKLYEEAVQSWGTKLKKVVGIEGVGPDGGAGGGSAGGGTSRGGHRGGRGVSGE